MRQSYAGAQITVEEKEIDPDRSIEIAIGATEDWSPIVCVLSSVRDRPIEIQGGSEAAVSEAIRAAHDEIFHNWPLSQYEIDELIRKQFREME